jgi:DNA topoisomerase-6 subunit B
VSVSTQITSSSTAEYFAKNLQQVGFSSATKAVLTTLKEAVDNSLDACEGKGILPELTVEITRIGTGSQKNTDLVQIVVEDNGPGLELEDLAQVFGEYLASSKFGRGQCTRGQQGIGISAATTWAQLTNATGVVVTSKTAKMRKAVRAAIDVDIKKNKGIIRSKDTLDWDRESGVRVEFKMDGRIQLNGDGGLLTYLEGTTLVNPHLTLNYKLLDQEKVTVPRVTDESPDIPGATNPHPHTMKLGEFMTHANLYGKVNLEKFLRSGFSRVTDQTIKEFIKNGIKKGLLEKAVPKITDEEFKAVFKVVQDTELIAPSTKSVLTVGEEALSKSIRRLGDIDFFSVVTRRPRICDFKPVVVEVALARFQSRGSEDEPVQVLRFANRVPLQFDKASCAITNAIESVNWRSYGLNQPKDSVPMGAYVFAISVVSPFIKFKNASKETIDGGDELVEEIRRALIQAGQKLSRHIRREEKEADLLNKIRHIEQFGPMLVEGLVRITKSSDARKKKAEEGLQQILGKDALAAEEDLESAQASLAALKARESHLHDDVPAESENAGGDADGESARDGDSEDSGAESEGRERGTKKLATQKEAVEKTTKKVAEKKTTAKKATTKTAPVTATTKTTAKKAKKR